MAYRYYPDNGKDKKTLIDIFHGQDSSKSYKATDFWAAAVMANRLNNGYVKHQLSPDQEPNIRLALKVLDIDPNLLSEADRVVSEEVKDYYRSLTFKILQGKNVNPYERVVMQCVDKDVIDSTRDMNIIVSSINSAILNIEKLKADRKITDARGGFIGTIGQWVELDVVVVKSVYSDYRKYYNHRQQMSRETYYITGITNDDQPVVFANKESIPVNSLVKIRAKVKSHRDIENITQLNYAKIISVDNPNVKNPDTAE